MKNLDISIDNFMPKGGMERYCLDLINCWQNLNIHILGSKIDPELAKRFSTQKISTQFDILHNSQLNSKIQKIRQGSTTKLLALNLCDNSNLLVCGGTHLGYLIAEKKYPSLKDIFTLKRSISAYNSAKHILAHSQLMQKELIELYGISPKKISLCYPPVDSIFQPYPQEQIPLLRREFGLDAKKKILLFPSSSHKRKGLALILEAISTLRNVQIAVAGRCVNHPQIINLGFVSNMPKLYACCDFSILASSYEPFGLVGIESILSGKKLIFARNIGCLEVVNPSCVYAFDLNKESLKQAITKALDDTQTIANPKTMLNYCPDKEFHAQKVLELLCKQ